jgi:hypothetical protein
LLVGEAASQLSDSACNESAKLGINEQLRQRYHCNHAE